MQQYLRRVQDSVDAINTDGHDDFPWKLFIPMGFFLLWNALLCVPTIQAFSVILRGECNAEVIPSGVFLLCPHWLIGIVVPMGAARVYGVGVTGYAILSVAFAIPYSVGIVWECIACQRGERQCCPHPSALSTFFNRQRGVQNTDESVPRTQQERDVETTRDTQSSPNMMPDQTINESNEVDFAPNLDNRTNQEMRECIEKNLQTKDFSARFCSICFDEFDAKENITISRNPECSHIFHRSCIMAWLEGHDNCPICRRVYRK